MTYKLNYALKYIDDNATEFIKNFGSDAILITKALICAEDSRGWTHYGVDYISLVRGIVKFITFKGFRGVSTIEQQLSRNIYRRENRNILLCKIDELVLSYRISKKRPKIAIWTAYLMSAYYGTNYTNYSKIRNKYCLHGELNEENAAKIISCLKYPLSKDEKINGVKRNDRVKFIQKAIYSTHF